MPLQGGTIMHSVPIMKEHQPSILLKVFSGLLIAAFATGAILNALYGNVTHPNAFLLVLAGFILFAIGKSSVILKKKISFGPKLMSENMANLYRLGYWLMIVGLIATFLP